MSSIQTAVLDVINRNGGIAGLVDKFATSGLAARAKSWVGLGENQPISAAVVSTVIGSESLTAIARTHGMSPGDLSRQLAKYLPEVIDHVTQDGKLPNRDDWIADAKTYLQRNA